jgi:hypothetical protein
MIHSLLLVAATAALTVSSIPAQSRLALREGSPPPAILTVDPTRVAEAMARADKAWQDGRGRDARRIYQELIAEQAAADEFAGPAMWRLALNYLYHDEPRRAAQQLDELAQAATRYGDPSLRLRATFESAVLWKQLKEPQRSMERIQSAMALLQSPAIPVEEKDAIRQRIK